MKFRFGTKNLWYRLLFCFYFFLLKSIFEIALQYVFNVFMLFLTVFYLKLNFMLKLDPKSCNFENLEETYKKPFANFWID